MKVKKVVCKKANNVEKLRFGSEQVAYRFPQKLRMTSRTISKKREEQKCPVMNLCTILNIEMSRRESLSVSIDNSSEFLCSCASLA